MEEFSKEAEDVGRDVNHHWGLRGIDVKFGKAHGSWRLSQGTSSPERFADESKIKSDGPVVYLHFSWR